MAERNEKWLALRSGDRHVMEDCRRSEVMQVQARYRFAKNFCNDKYVLDVGCGTGFGTLLLSGSSKKVLGIDISKEAIDYANVRFSNSNLSFLTMNCKDLKFSNYVFDIVTAFEIIEHLLDHTSFLLEMKRVLAPSGLFICSTINKSAFGSKGTGAEFHHHEFTHEDFKQTLQSYFKRVQIYGQHFLCRDAKIDIHPLNRYIIRVKRILGLKENFCPRLRPFIIKSLFGEETSDITEDKFPIDGNDIEHAPFFVAVCSKE